MISADGCSACGGDSRVLETRQRGEDGAIRRRRKCMRCGTKWTTAEMRVQRGQTVSTLPIQALRDLRDKMFSILRVLGVERADADAVLEAEEDASRLLVSSDPAAAADDDATADGGAP